MRTEGGRDPHDRGLQDLVGELSTRSETFRRLWAAHDVRTHGTGTNASSTPSWASSPSLRGARRHRRPGLVLLIYTADPAHSAERLRLLASWAASEQAPIPTDHS